MGNLRAMDGLTNGGTTNGPTIDRRGEPRTAADLALTVWGVDTKGERFLQPARARDVSLSGEILTTQRGLPPMPSDRKPLTTAC